MNNQAAASWSWRAQPPSHALAMLCGALVVGCTLTTGQAFAQRVNSAAPAAFSDGTRAPIRRVFAYRQENGVRAFTDRVPANQRYEVMAFTCYACNPASTINWQSTALHVHEYSAEIAAAATTYGVDAALIRAVMHAESGFNPDARSPKGAIGLMQLMPDTARGMGIADVAAIGANINGGVKYLAALLAQYKGDVTLATAAYNSGPMTVDRYRGVPPIAETRSYVARVKVLHARYRSAS